MANGYDRDGHDEHDGTGGSFLMGLLTGTVLGAGLGMLFAPRSGADLRHQLSEQAGALRETASEGYRRASVAAADAAGKGRDAYDKARTVVVHGAEVAGRVAGEAVGEVAGMFDPDASDEAGARRG